LPLFAIFAKTSVSAEPRKSLVRDGVLIPVIHERERQGTSAKAATSGLSRQLRILGFFAESCWIPAHIGDDRAAQGLIFKPIGLPLLLLPSFDIGLGFRRRSPFRNLCMQSADQLVAQGCGTLPDNWKCL
jgi:hypothetical protein